MTTWIGVDTTMRRLPFAQRAIEVHASSRFIKPSSRSTKPRPTEVTFGDVRIGPGEGMIHEVPSKLSRYRAKRDPSKTPEPMGTGHKPRRPNEPDQATFVIQEHHARALHWDFRLERDGVLVSWALPKGLPESPKANHLAIHTEDHPLEYAGFEGQIPKGEYGGGQVIIWDHGTYETDKWRDDEVMVVLHGQRVSGRYVLFATSGQNWMIRHMDPPLQDFEPMPERVRPMLARLGHLPRSDEGWAYEFKWDGVRAIVYVEAGKVRALTRNDKDLVSSFPELRDLGEFLGARSAVLDGEIVAFDEHERPNFGKLAHRLHLTSRATIARLAKTSPASFLAFDLLHLEGRSLITRPYDERRRLLESLELAGETFATPPSIRPYKGSDVLAVARERCSRSLKPAFCNHRNPRSAISETRVLQAAKPALS